MQGRVIMMTMMLHNQIGLCAHAFGGLPLIRGTLWTGGTFTTLPRWADFICGHNVLLPLAGIGSSSGGLTTLAQSDRQAFLAKGDLAILDSTHEYVVDAQQGFEALWVRVPRHRIEGRLAHHNRLMAERIDGSMGVGRLASVMLRSALREAPRIVATDANRITNAILDLIGMSLSSRVPHLTRFSRSGQSTLRKIQQYIEEHLDDEDLTLSSLARANLVSARYVNRLFMREGVSAARWIRMRRLERCRADLEDPEKRHLSISEIAFNHGFGNISSFNRAFKARFHITPIALRNV